MPSSILIADDETLFCDMLCAALKSLAANVTGCYNAADAWEKISRQHPQLVILDVNMPETSGLTLLSRIRNEQSLKHTYVILLTARSHSDDKIAGLESGADDYITKPFELPELFARVRAGLRRVTLSKPEDKDITIPARGLVMIRDSFEVFIDNNLLNLTQTEFFMLELFIRNQRQVLSREYLLLNALGSNNSGARTIDTHINNLRRKLSAAAGLANSLICIRSIGYKFVPPDDYPVRLY